MLFKFRQIDSFRWLSFMLSQSRNVFQAPLKLHKNPWYVSVAFWMVSFYSFNSVFEKIRSDDKDCLVCSQFWKESGFRNEGTSAVISTIMYNNSI